MEWLFVVVGTLVVLFGIIVFFVGTEKGDRKEIVKKELVGFGKSSIKTLLAVSIVSAFLKFSFSGGGLSYIDIFIALIFLVIFYSAARNVITFITYSFIFLTKRNKTN